MLEKHNYSKKKFLIIEDFPEFRLSVKRMVESLGAKIIDTAMHGEDAIEKMSKRRYDYVLSDYNLGEGKDGQQVLEEGKHRGYVKSTTIYIMLTAESTLNMVMGALEYEPDGYLAKPFNKEMLINRLEKITQKKESLMNILKLIDGKKDDEALVLCDKEIDNESRIALDCLKIKGDILLKQKNFAAAYGVYDGVLDERQTLWALLGIGKALYYQEEYYDASEKFQDLIDQNQMCVEAYDWLAKCKNKLGDPLDAQTILENAVRLSPKAILRQQALGLLALENEDFAVAEKAFRHAVKLGKHSCYQRPDDSLNLVESLLVKVVPDAGISGKRAGNESLQVIKELLRKHRSDEVLKLKALVLEGETFAGLKQIKEAKTSLDKAEKIYQKLGDKAPADAAIKLANGFIKVGEEEKGRELTREIIKVYFEDDQLKDEIKNLATTAGIRAESDNLYASEEERLKDLNKKGVRFFQEGKLQEAVELFEKAAEDMPHNVSINLNAAQALIRYMEHNGKDSKMLNRSRRYLDRVKGLDKDDKRFNRYMELVKLHQSVVDSR